MRALFKFRIKEYGTGKILLSRRTLDHVPSPGDKITLADGAEYTIASVSLNAARFGTLTVFSAPS